MVDLPPHAFPPVFVDRGKIRGPGNSIIFGSDPHIIKEGSEFVLHSTFGPTKPGFQGYPGIYQRRSLSIDGPYSEGLLKISPFPAGALPDECGNETFTADKGNSGNYTGIYHGYRFGSRTLRSQNSLIRVTSPVAMTTWTKGAIVIAEDVAFGGILVMAEAAIIHIPGGNQWEGTFNVRSTIAEKTAHRVYRMSSADDGVTWTYSTTPILVPESWEEASGGFNAITHCHLVRDERVGHPTVWHLFYTHTGKVARTLKGIKHYAALETDLNTWTANPNGLLLGHGPVGSETETHVDTPAVWLNPVGFTWHMIFRGQNDRLRGSTTLETLGRNHLRYATP